MYLLARSPNFWFGWQVFTVKRKFIIQLFLATLLLSFGISVPAASAAARVTKVVKVTSQLSIITVYSPSMRKAIPNQVLRPAGNASGAPTLILLNGKGGGESGMNDNWRSMTDYEGFFRNKNVNVVSPVGGKHSWYANWNAADSVVGIAKWQTYLSVELPSAINKYLAANGKNAIAGLSMSGGPAINIGGRAPGVFRAAASFSGCPAISTQLGMAGVMATVASGGANPLNMYGGPGSAQWSMNDPARHPERYRRVKLYMSAASGTPGAVDGRYAKTGQLLTGPAQVEQITKYCSDEVARALKKANVGHTYKVFPRGAHTWSLFFAGLTDGWNRVLGPALGVA